MPKKPSLLSKLLNALVLTTKRFVGITVMVGALLYIGVTLPQVHSNLLFAKSASKIGLVTTMEQQGHGTGFFIKAKSGKRFIMTNNHVCKIIPNGGLFVNERITTFVMPFYKDNIADICLLKYPENAKTPSDFELGTEPLINQDLWTMGYPLDHLKHFSKGAVSGDRLVDIAEPVDADCKNIVEIPTLFGPIPICVIRRVATETSVTIFPGNSGSPVLNIWGNVVGIMFAGNGQSNLGIMARWADVKRVLERN